MPRHPSGSWGHTSARSTPSSQHTLQTSRPRSGRRLPWVRHLRKHLQRPLVAEDMLQLRALDEDGARVANRVGADALVLGGRARHDHHPGARQQPPVRGLEVLARVVIDAGQAHELVVRDLKVLWAEPATAPRVLHVPVSMHVPPARAPWPPSTALHAMASLVECPR